jgi:hypothetical protein
MLLGWRMFSPLGGLAAGLAYATNPWAVFYARKIWNPDSVAPWAVLLFLALDQAVVANRMAWAVGTFPIFAIGLQMHFSIGVLAPLLLAPSAVLMIHRRWRLLALGVALAVLATTPYLTYVYQSGGADFQALQSILSRTVRFDGAGADYVVGMTTGWDHWYVLNVHVEHLVSGRIAATAGRLETVLLALGLVVALVSAAVPGIARRDRRLRFAGLLLWLGLPPLLTIRHAVPLYEHYYVIVLPAAALLIAGGICWLADRPGVWRRPLLGIGLASLIAVASIQAFMVVRLLDYVTVAYEPNYGPPLARSAALTQELAAIGASSGSQHLAVEVGGLDREPIAYLARPYFPNLELVRVGQVGLGPGLATSPMPARNERLASHVLTPLQQLDLHYSDGVRVLSASNSPRGVIAERLGLAITWAGGGPLGTAESGVLWEVSLYTLQGQEVARQPGLRHAPSEIAADQTCVSWFSLATPPDAAWGQYQLRLRRLDPLTGRALLFVDSDGQSASEWRSALIDVQGQ